MEKHEYRERARLDLIQLFIGDEEEIGSVLQFQPAFHMVEPGTINHWKTKTYAMNYEELGMEWGIWADGD